LCGAIFLHGDNMVAKVNFKLSQGSTFKTVLRWESEELVYKPITTIAKSAPVSITSTAHELVNGWRVKVNSVLGMKEINFDDFAQVTVIDANTVSFNKINSLGYTAYTSSGVLVYYKPVDLTGMTARMQLRTSLASEEVVHSLTTENGGIILDNITKEIKLNIPAAITASFTSTSYVYNLEIVDSIGTVEDFASGAFNIVKEVTR
jgi:hypothetical protein